MPTGTNFQVFHKLVLWICHILSSRSYKNELLIVLNSLYYDSSKTVPTDTQSNGFPTITTTSPPYSLDYNVVQRKESFTLLKCLVHKIIGLEIRRETVLSRCAIQSCIIIYVVSLITTSIATTEHNIAVE